GKDIYPLAGAGVFVLSLPVDAPPKAQLGASRCGKHPPADLIVLIRASLNGALRMWNGGATAQARIDQQTSQWLAGLAPELLAKNKVGHQQVDAVRDAEALHQ